MNHCPNTQQALCTCAKNACATTHKGGGNFAHTTDFDTHSLTAVQCDIVSRCTAVFFVCPCRVGEYGFAVSLVHQTTECYEERY